MAKLHCHPNAHRHRPHTRGNVYRPEPSARHFWSPGARCHWPRPGAALFTNGSLVLERIYGPGRCIPICPFGHPTFWCIAGLELDGCAGICTGEWRRPGAVFSIRTASRVSTNIEGTIKPCPTLACASFRTLTHWAIARWRANLGGSRSYAGPICVWDWLGMAGDARQNSVLGHGTAHPDLDYRRSVSYTCLSKALPIGLRNEVHQNVFKLSAKN